MSPSLELKNSAPGRYTLDSTPSPLWSTLPPGSSVADAVGGATAVSFPAASADPLARYIETSGGQLTYARAVVLLSSLVMQLRVLEARHGLTVPFYSPDDIIVVDGRGYVASPDALQPLVDGEFVVTGDRTRLPFLPPECPDTGQFVGKPGCSLYTLASLAGACLFPKWPQRSTYADCKATLEPIVLTSLYWAILRCLGDEPSERVYLYL